MFMSPFNSQRREATSLHVNCLFTPVICVEERLVGPLASDVSPSSSLILERKRWLPIRKRLESAMLMRWVSLQIRESSRRLPISVMILCTGILWRQSIQMLVVKELPYVIVHRFTHVIVECRRALLKTLLESWCDIHSWRARFMAGHVKSFLIGGYLGHTWVYVEFIWVFRGRWWTCILKVLVAKQISSLIHNLLYLLWILRYLLGCSVVIELLLVLRLTRL